jgi:hypothetical protein
MPRTQHLLIPFAHASPPACTQALKALRLPHLGALAQRWGLGARDDGDDFDLAAPHERALAAAWGWQGAPAAWPFAALAAQADGIDTGERAWGLLTPCHWHVGRDQISLLDPDTLALEADESRAFLEAVRELFESEGMALAYGAAQRWYVAHDSLQDLPCAGLDRAIGRNVDPWLPAGRQGRLIRRLQNEVQMLLYQSPLNDAREARGLPTVNSFWLSGCGRFQPPSGPPVRVLDALRAPALAQDWAAWGQAWQALDAGPLAELRERDDVTLTLCGERSSQSLCAQSVSLWRGWGLALRQRWQAPSPHVLLESL